MANYDDILKAQEKINSLLKLGEEIQKSAPYLITIQQNLNWYAEVYQKVESKKEEIITSLEGPLQNINDIKYSEFSLTSASGSAAMFVTTSSGIVNIIESAGDDYRYLLNEYKEINQIEMFVDNILTNLKFIDADLYEHFKEVSNSYSQWKVDQRTNSDLAKDTRTFQEQFEGILNKLRVPRKFWEQAKIPKMSWNKMVNTISKEGSENRKAFMKQQKISEEIWKKLTPVLKKTEDISKDRMESLFKRYLEHLYSVINLIDEKYLLQA